MRVVLGLVATAACAAAATMWLVPAATDSGLAVVSGVGAGGMAQVARPATRVPAATAVPSEKGAAAGKDAGLAENAGQQSRFFGYALPFSQDKPAPARREVTEAAPQKSWATDVVIYPAGREPAASAEPAMAPAARVVTAPVPKLVTSQSRDKPRYELVRDLQRELRRVGCYVGEVDGEWGPGSKRSMRAFMDRVNSGLQSDEPDLIQLTLVQGYAGVACRQQTPAAPPLITAGRPAHPQLAVREPAVREPVVPLPPVGVAPPVPVVVPSSPIQTGALPPSAVPLPGRIVPLEGRMAVGGPMPPLQSAPLPAPSAPAVNAVRIERPRAGTPPPRQRAAPRRERNWTANFFNN